MSNSRHLLFVNAGHFFHHYLLAILPVISLSIQQAWSLSDAQAVSLGTAMFALLAMSTLPAGWLGDVWPRRHMMGVCLCGSAVAAILAGMSNGPLMMTAALAALGMFSAIYHPVGLAMVADHATLRGPAFARNGIFGNVGGGVAAACSALIAGYIHWRVAFMLPGGILLLVGLNYVSRSSLDEGRRSALQATPKCPGKNSTIRTVGAGLLAFLLVASVYDGLVAGAITYTLPRLIQTRALVDHNLLLIGGSTSIILTLGSFAQLVSGWVVERFGGKKLLVILFTAQIIALVCASQFTGIALIVIMMLFYALLYAWFPITAWLICRHISAERRARVLSIEYLASLGTSAATVPFVAWLYGRGISSHDQLWIVILAAVAALFSIALLPQDATGHGSPAEHTV